LDDLIVGAHETKLSGKEKAGKSYVVFGKKALITKPPVPLAIADRSIAVLSVLPKTT
jgi:hypothetical protein